MLIKSSVKVNDVVTIRLTTGEEIVGRLKTDSMTSVFLTKPALLHVQQTPEGLDVRFGAILISGETDEVEFYKTAMHFAPILTRDEIRTGYQQATSSIVTPPSGIIKP